MYTSLHRAGLTRRTQQTAAYSVVLLIALLLVLCVAGPAFAYVPGKIIWQRASGTSAHERGFSCAAKASNGQFYAAGWVQTSAVKGNDVLVAKYDAAGHTLWSRVWDGGGDPNPGDGARAATSDAKGNLYVAVDSAAGPNESDIVTIKYSPTGARKWVARWTGDGGTYEAPRAIAVDARGNVVVVGSRSAGFASTAIVAIKYDASGVEKWVTQIVANPMDAQDGAKSASDVAVDAAGDAYVAGHSYYGGIGHAVLVKLATSDGAEVQRATYDAAVGSYASSVAVRGETVMIAGWAAQTTSQEDVLVVKYDRDLAEQYRLEYAYPHANARDFGEDVAIGARGGVFVCGYTNFPPPGGSGFYNRALVLRVNAAGTRTQWVKTYKPTGMGASAGRILLDGADNLYVDGYLDTETSEENMLIAKYSSTGTRKWARSWHDTGKDDDWVGGLVLGSSRVLFVAGTGWAKGDYERAVALRINR